jgi:hypothetical protein
MKRRPSNVRPPQAPSARSSNSPSPWTAIWQSLWEDLRQQIPRARSIDWSELRETVRAHDVVVLYASIVDAPSAPEFVLGHFNTTVWIDLRTFASCDPETREWIESEIARLGRPFILPGFYLFARGQLRAHDLGLPDVAHDAKAMAAALATLVGHMAGAAPLTWGGVLAAHIVTAQRVIGEFSAKLRALDATSASGTRIPPASEPRPTVPVRDDLSIAFQVLGVPADAPHATVKERYRALAKQWHPDRFVGEEIRGREAAVRMQDINVAYTVVRRARGWS